jgi:hypothetical protein
MRCQQVMCAATLILVASLVGAGFAQAQSATQDGVPTGCRPFESVREIIPSPLFPHNNTLFAIVGTGDWPDTPVLRSADGGITWTPIRLAGLIALDLSFSQAYATDETLYVSLRGSTVTYWRAPSTLAQPGPPSRSRIPMHLVWLCLWPL